MNDKMPETILGLPVIINESDNSESTEIIFGSISEVFNQNYKVKKYHILKCGKIIIDELEEIK